MNDEQELNEWREAYFRLLDEEQPLELPCKGRESHLEPGQKYQTHEEIEDCPDGKTPNR